MGGGGGGSKYSPVEMEEGGVGASGGDESGKGGMGLPGRR